MRLTNKQLASRLRGIGASQELAVTAFAEDGSCTEYLIDAAARLDRIETAYTHDEVKALIQIALAGGDYSAALKRETGQKP